jgi:hypothetical protein
VTEQEKPKLLIQGYLEADGTLGDLVQSYTIKARRHGKYENLVLLKYGIDAAFMNPMVRECRGIILDEAKGWEVVSRAFDKFGNEGEGYVPEIDWSTARVQEKLDGSLCVLYHYDGAWHVATSGSPDASGDVQRAGVHQENAFEKGYSFASYFWDTFNASNGRLPQNTDLCFAFELMGPLNRIVVVHEKAWLRLLAARDRETGKQYFPEDVAYHVNIEPVRSFPLTSLAEIVASFEHISPVSQEGYVVVDGNFNRVKIKHPGYVALHHAKDGMGPKAFVQIARTGEVGEVISAFPEFQPLIAEARAKYDALVTAVKGDYARLRDIPEQKAFALEALKTPYSAALFQMRKGVAVEDFFRDIAIEKLSTWMGVELPSAPSSSQEEK